MAVDVNKAFNQQLPAWSLAPLEERRAGASEQDLIDQEVRFTEFVRDAALSSPDFLFNYDTGEMTGMNTAIQQALDTKYQTAVSGLYGDAGGPDQTDMSLPGSPDIAFNALYGVSAPQATMQTDFDRFKQIEQMETAAQDVAALSAMEFEEWDAVNRGWQATAINTRKNILDDTSFQRSLGYQWSKLGQPYPSIAPIKAPEVPKPPAFVDEVGMARQRESARSKKRKGYLSTFQSGTGLLT